MNKQILDSLFTLPDEYFLEIPKQLDTLVDRGSDTLVMTFGDSWTWGGSLDPTERKSVIFGNVISEILNADYKNIGVPSVSNRWIVNQVKKFHDAKLELPYKRVVLIVMLTEMCREFNTRDDIDTNYIQELKDCNTLNDIVQTLADINSKIVLDSVVENTQLIVGRTYTCDLYNKLSDVMVSDSWLDLICDKSNITRVNNVYVLQPWAIEKLKSSTEFVDINKDQLLSDIVNCIDTSIDALKRLEQSKFNMQGRGYKHPNAGGHELWAKHLLKFIK